MSRDTIKITNTPNQRVDISNNRVERIGVSNSNPVIFRVPPATYDTLGSVKIDKDGGLNITPDGTLSVNNAQVTKQVQKEIDDIKNGTTIVEKAKEANTLNGHNGDYYLNYNNFENKPQLSDYLKKKESTSTKIQVDTSNEAHFNSRKSLYIGNSTTGNLKDETSFVQTDDKDGSTPALQKISVQMKDGNFYVRDRFNRPVLQIRNQATKSTNNGVTKTSVSENDIRFQNVEKIKLNAGRDLSIGSGGAVDIYGNSQTTIQSGTKVKLSGPEILVDGRSKVEVCYDNAGNENTKLKLDNQGANLISDNKVGLRYENGTHSARIVLLQDNNDDSRPQSGSEVEIEAGHVQVTSTYGITLNGQQVATTNKVPTKTSQLENDSGFVNKQIIPSSINSQFAISSSGTDLTADLTKHPTTSALNTRQRAITYGNGIWVAGDAYGALQYSVDNGISWEKTPALTNKHGATETTTITGLAFGKGYFVAVSYGDPNKSIDGTVYKSTDGISWTIVDVNVSGLGDVIYASGRFVFVAKQGEVVFSDDLEHFELINIGYAADFATIVFGKDRFFTGTGDSGGAVDNKQIYYSLDGLNWQAVYSDVLAAGNGSDYWGGGCYGKGKYLLGGRSRTLNGTTYSIAYSEDCVNWYPANCPPSNMFIRSVKYIYGKFFAVGYNGSVGEIWSSLDGINWQVESAGLTRQWVLGCGDDFLLSLGDSGSGMRYVFNIEWLDAEPEITADKVLWQKTQLRLTDGSLLESEVEVHTNLTAISKSINNITITDLRGTP